MNIQLAIDKLKNSSQNPIELIRELECFYNEIKKKQEQICDVCVEWMKMDLPKDCLSRPSYCVKNEKELVFTIWYEELKITATNTR